MKALFAALLLLALPANAVSFSTPSGDVCTVACTATIEPPPPVPPPPTVPPGVIEIPLGAQGASLFTNVEADVLYTVKLPFPFTSDMSIQIGQGQGLTPTFMQMAVSDTPGGGVPSQFPQGTQGDPNGGLVISMSLNPQGRTPYQARVTNDRQWYLNFAVNFAGSISRDWY